jgi:hypothetical protein
VGIASQVLGIVGTIVSLIPYIFYLGIALSTVGLALAIAARRRARARGRPAGAAIAGLVVGIVGTLAGVTNWVLSAAAHRGTERAIDDFARQMSDPEIRKKLQEDNRDFEKLLRETFPRDGGL